MTEAVGSAWSLDLSTFTPPNIPDGLWFHGWGPEGRVFAWERREESAGADCGTKHVLYAVDAASDEFVQGGLLKIAHKSPDTNAQGTCVPADLGVAAKRAEFLKRHRITAVATKPQRVEATKGDYRIAGDTGLRLKFEVRHRTTDPFDPEVDKGAAYRLIVRSGERSVVVEEGKRRRPNVIDYRLGQARWFSSPDGTYGALILERIERGFEGAHATWMSNGVRVKARPVGSP